MKKIVALLMVAMLAIFMVGCGSSTDEGQNQIDVADSQELLQGIWDSYADDEKFPIIGGDNDNFNNEGPAGFSIEDASALDVTLGFPADSVDKIDDAASLMHMMNANTFTCGAYRVVEGEDVTALCDEIKENIKNRQWMCGFPDELVVVAIDNYVISFFGKTDVTDVFQEKLLEVYPSAEVVAEESLV